METGTVKLISLEGIEWIKKQTKKEGVLVSNKGANGDQQINSKHVYVENSDGKKINGIATVNSSLIDGNKTTSRQIQWYHFTYDVQKYQVTKITPVSVN
ncbi:hypothetical protein ABVE96_16075 (plasmid) [Lactiplantibacillus plantarum]|uniref:hypothetical protein n=1 Tax=Lactiplantibacillus plantarum TaxID=1590 RepID=UPI00338F6EEE